MINALLDTAKQIIHNVIQPNKWSLDDAVGKHGSANYPRVAFESTILKHQIKPRDPIMLTTMAAFQYQVNFRFPGSLNYEQLPKKELNDILSYLTFIFSAHPTLLSKSPAEINSLGLWQYSHVDPCLYDNTEADIEIQRLSLNSFIPIIEQGNHDWLMVLVLSFEVEFDAKKSAYRKYFADNLTDQIAENPAYSGGLIGEINRVDIGIHKKPDRLVAEVQI